jgi:hypothetical protein
MLSRTRGYEWYARFRDGRENLEDVSSERLKAVRTPDMIETVQKLISTHHRMTLRMMEEEIEIIRNSQNFGRKPLEAEELS